VTGATDELAADEGPAVMQTMKITMISPLSLALIPFCHCICNGR
jgi:hypothetical protein